MNMGPMKHWLPFLNNTNPIEIPELLLLSESFLTTEHCVQIYSNQKDDSNVKASVTPPPPPAVQFFPILYPHP